MFSSRDREKCEQLYEKYYAGRKFHDGLYRDVITKYLRPRDWLLDAGCGRYMTFCNDFSLAARVVGIDLESSLATTNKTRPFGVRGDVGHLPFQSGFFDMVISRSVVEHLEDPPQVFREFWRVLRPGGSAVIMTPNKYDYVSLIATLTPYSWHRSLVSKIFKVSEDDVFPTKYRANTIASMRRALTSAGFVEREFSTINHYPAYLMFSPFLFQLGVLYERLTSLEPLRFLRGSILCVFQKPPSMATVGSTANHRSTLITDLSAGEL